MKTVSLMLSMIAFIALGSCNQSVDANALLKNAETRTEIMNTIAGNHSYMTEFMDAMQNNCLLYTSPSPRDRTRSRMPSSA